MKLLLLIAVIVLFSSISADFVPLERLYRSKDGYHHYTAGEKDTNLAINSYGFTRKGSPGLVSTSATGCEGITLEPVFRLYKPGTYDTHLFTVCESESTNYANNLGYRYEGIRFYCVSYPGECGASIPLYKFWTGKRHFYTVDIDEGNTVAAGGKYEGVLCYLWAPK